MNSGPFPRPWQRSPGFHVIQAIPPGPCCSTRSANTPHDLPHVSGARITPAEWIQEATLAALSDRFSVVIQDTDPLLRRAATAAWQVTYP